MEWTKNASPTSGIDTRDDVAASGDDWQAVSNQYRERWQEHYGASADAASWERYEPRYRFAWEMARLPGYAGQPWPAVRAELGARWEVLHPEVEWDTVADTVHDAWEHVAGAAGTPPAPPAAP